MLLLLCLSGQLVELRNACPRLLSSPLLTTRWKEFVDRKKTGGSLCLRGRERRSNFKNRIPFVAGCWITPSTMTLTKRCRLARRALCLWNHFVPHHTTLPSFLLAMMPLRNCSCKEDPPLLNHIIPIQVEPSIAV